MLHRANIGPSLMLYVIRALNEKTYVYLFKRHKQNKDTNQPANPCTLMQIFHCSHEETYHPCLSKIRPVKILIRLHECAGGSKSSLGAYFRRIVFSSIVDYTAFLVKCVLTFTCCGRFRGICILWTLLTAYSTTVFIFVRAWLTPKGTSFRSCVIHSSWRTRLYKQTK